MPGATPLIEALREHLIDEGIVRDPRVAGSLPPCWRSPKNGVPQPGQGTTVEKGDPVVGLFPAPGVPMRSYDAGVLRKDGVDIRIRSSTPTAAIDLDDQIREVLSDQRAYQLGDLLIVESLLERPLDLVVSDDQGYDFVAGYIFERHA